MTETEIDLATPSELPGGVTPSPPPDGFGQGLADFGQAVHAAYKAERFDGDMFGRQNALSDAADRRNWEIQRATGVQLENPLEGGYAREARDRLMAGGVTGHIQDVQLQIHQEKLDRLKEQFPDHAQTIGADRPLLADAKQLADYWRERAARGEPGLNAVAGLAASFLGGLGAFGWSAITLRNPLNAASLLIGGGEAKATGIALRIAESALRQGAVNAGFQAVAEPGVQAWRAERGQEAGVGPVLHDIGMAALFGAVPGAGIEAGKIALPHLRGLIRGAEADRAAFAEPPPAKGLQESVEQALRHGEGVSEALPEMPAAAEISSTANEVEKIIAPGADPFEAAARLRGSSADIDRALASDAPDLRAAGRLATLGDAAFVEARAGRVDLDVALATAARVSDEAEQIAVMRGASVDKPLNAEEAAAAVTREMETRATPVALSHIRGADEAASAVPKPKFERDIAKGADEQIEALTRALEAEDAPPVVVEPTRPVTRKNPSLFEALAGGGGLGHHSELAAIFDGNPFVPGFGRLMREGGMSLDDALRTAKELGYLYDPAEHGTGELTLSVNDLLDKLRDEAHGSRVFRIGHEPPSKELAAQAAELKARHKDALKVLKALPELQPRGKPRGSEWKPSKDILDRAAALMAEDDGLAPLAAWDRAAVAYERELRALKDQFEPIQKGRVDEFGEIPGWDIPAEIRADSGAAPEGRGAAAGAGEGAAGEGGAPRGAGDQIRGDGGSHRPLSSERTDAGEQTLVPGIEPVSDKQRAEARAAKPLRGGDAPPPGGGLFDDGARAQTDLLDLVPTDDGRALTREDILKAPTREEMIASVVSRCPF